MSIGVERKDGRRQGDARRVRRGVVEALRRAQPRREHAEGLRDPVGQCTSCRGSGRWAARDDAVGHHALPARARSRGCRSRIDPQDDDAVAGRAPTRLRVGPPGNQPGASSAPAGRRAARAVEPLAPDAVEAMRAWLLERELLHDATLVSVLAYAGIRPGEALALTWSHVRERTLLDEATVSVGVVGETKTRRRRTVRLLPPLGCRPGRVAAARRRAGRGRARLPGPRRPAIVPGQLQELAPAGVPARDRGRPTRRGTAVRPAPLVRVAAHRGGPQRRRGRPPSRRLAEDGARHVRARLRGRSSTRPSGSTPPSASARRASSCDSAPDNQRSSTPHDDVYVIPI